MILAKVSAECLTQMLCIEAMLPDAELSRDIGNDPSRREQHTMRRSKSLRVVELTIVFFAWTMAVYYLFGGREKVDFLSRDVFWTAIAFAVTIVIVLLDKRARGDDSGK